MLNFRVAPKRENFFNVFEEFCLRGWLKVFHIPKTLKVSSSFDLSDKSSSETLGYGLFRYKLVLFLI